MSESDVCRCQILTYRLYTSEFDVCRRQILTYKDGPRTERIKYLLWPYTYNIGIQMNRKEITKTFMMISNWKKHLVFMVYTKIYQRCKG